MNLTLTRLSQNAIRTRGEITDDDSGAVVVPATLELPWRDNQHDISCIPAGVYTCAYTDHPTHGWVYQVMDVPDRDAILLHIGNKPADTEGCILLAERDDPDGTDVDDSGTAFRAFMAYTNGIPSFQLTVLDAVS